MKQAKRIKTKSERQTKMIKTYLNEEEYKAFKVNKGGLTESRFLRESALAQTPLVIIDDNFIRELAQLGANLNQIARNTNVTKQVDSMVLEQLKELENRLKIALDNIVENAKGGDQC